MIACCCAGIMSMAFVEPHLCPHDSTVEVSRRSDAESVKLKFVNDAGIDVSLFWVNFEGEEVLYDDIAPAGAYLIWSGHSHAWTVRSTMDNGLLLATVIAPTDVFAELYIEPCLDAPLTDNPRTVSGKKMRRKLGLGVSAASPDVSSSHASEDLLWGQPDQDRNLEYLRAAFPQCDLEDALGEVAVPGFYVLCMQRSDRARRDGGGLDVGVAVSLNDAVTLFTIREEAVQDPKLLRAAIRHGVGFGKRKVFGPNFRFPPFALYTTDGRYRIVHPRDMLPGSPYNKRGTAYLFEAGNFVWPGVKPGHTRVVSDVVGSVGDLTLTTLSLKPLLYEVKGALSDENCDHIIETAGLYLSPSRVGRPFATTRSGMIQRDYEEDSVTSNRTSASHFLNRGQTDRLKNIERRVRDFTRLPIIHGEETQVLRYYAGQHYRAHHDYFDPEYYLEDEDTLVYTQYGTFNRLATVFWYLNDVPDGGETNFPMADGNERGKYSEWSHGKYCEMGISVRPERGKMIMFYNMLPNGELDEYSLHAGCDVGEGHVKWAANKWIWTKPVVWMDKRWDGDASDAMRDSMQIPDWSDEVLDRVGHSEL